MRLQQCYRDAPQLRPRGGVFDYTPKVLGNAGVQIDGGDVAFSKC
jgi:hypothetical protein